MRQPAAGHARGLHQGVPLRGGRPPKGFGPRTASGFCLAEPERGPPAARRTQRLGRPLGCCDPDDHSEAPRAGAGGRCGGEIDVRLRELRRGVGNRAHAVVALGEKRALRLAKRDAGSLGGLSERGRVFRNEIDLRLAVAERESEEAEQVDAAVSERREDPLALCGACLEPSRSSTRRVAPSRAIVDLLLEPAAAARTIGRPASPGSLRVDSIVVQDCGQPGACRRGRGGSCSVEAVAGLAGCPERLCRTGSLAPLIATITRWRPYELRCLRRPRRRGDRDELARRGLGVGARRAFPRRCPTDRIPDESAAAVVSGDRCVPGSRPQPRGAECLGR
jgi:hypothetical protein